MDIRPDILATCSACHDTSPLNRAPRASIAAFSPTCGPFGRPWSGSSGVPNLAGEMDLFNPDVLVPCPACGLLPERPAACPMCGDRRHPRFAGLPGRVWVPLADLAAHVQLERSALSRAGLDDDAGQPQRHLSSARRVRVA